MGVFLFANSFFFEVMFNMWNVHCKPALKDQEFDVGRIQQMKGR